MTVTITTQNRPAAIALFQWLKKSAPAAWAEVLRRIGAPPSGAGIGAVTAEAAKSSLNDWLKSAADAATTVLGAYSQYKDQSNKFKLELEKLKADAANGTPTTATYYDPASAAQPDVATSSSSNTGLLIGAAALVSLGLGFVLSRPRQ